MNKAVLRILCVVMAVLTVLPVAACGGTGEGEDTTLQIITDETTAAPPQVISLSTGEKYAIVRPDEASDEIIEACRNLRTAIKSKTGIEPEFKSDFLNDKAGFKESPYEIIVGECDRDSSRRLRSSLKYNDYAVAVDGKQLVIAGGNDAATVKAVKYFTSNLLTPEAEYTEGELYRYGAEYQVTSLKLNGTDIMEYRLVYAQSEKNNYSAAVDTFNNYLKKLTGSQLTAVPSTEAPSAHEIQLGDCGRGPSAGIKAEGDFMRTLVCDGNNIAIAASGTQLASEAIKDFLEINLPADTKGDVQITVPAGTDTSAVQIGLPLTDGAQVRIMSNNVLSDSTLADRSKILVRVYMEYFPAIIGMQECSSVGHANVIGKLGEFYGSVCTKIGNTTKTCCTPILYRLDVYEPVASDSFLYDSRWPKTDTKTLSWAVFKDKNTGKLVGIINTHASLILGSYDTESVFGKKLSDSTDGKLWREDNSRQILETKNMILEKYGKDIPVVVMGDLNANLNAKSVTMLSPELRNCITAASVSRTASVNSYHNNPGEAPSGTNPIDHMLVTPDNTDVYTHLILMTEDGIDCSDHCPLICEMSFK